jgi:hypothetical protein
MSDVSADLVEVGMSVLVLDLSNDTDVGPAQAIPVHAAGDLVDAESVEQPS